MTARFPTGLALGLGLAATALTGCGSGSAPAAGGPATSASQSASTVPCPTSTPAEANPVQFGRAPKVTVARTAYTMKIVIACKGTITIAMNAAKTPATVSSFAFLAAHHWFNDTPCQRLTSSGLYILQCGDPTGTGTGGPGYTLPDENLQSLKVNKSSGSTIYRTGMVAMANQGQPHTGGSQFFLVYHNSVLAPSYTPFGRITSGLSILKEIAAAGSNPPQDGAPINPVVISSLTVTKG